MVEVALQSLIPFEPIHVLQGTNVDQTLRLLQGLVRASTSTHVSRLPGIIAQVLGKSTTSGSGDVLQRMEAVPTTQEPLPTLTHGTPLSQISPNDTKETLDILSSLIDTPVLKEKYLDRPPFLYFFDIVNSLAAITPQLKLLLPESLTTKIQSSPTQVSTEEKRQWLDQVHTKVVELATSTSIVSLQHGPMFVDFGIASNLRSVNVLTGKETGTTRAFLRLLTHIHRNGSTTETEIGGGMKNLNLSSQNYPVSQTTTASRSFAPIPRDLISGVSNATNLTRAERTQPSLIKQNFSREDRHVGIHQNPRLLPTSHFISSFSTDPSSLSLSSQAVQSITLSPNFLTSTKDTFVENSQITLSHILPDGRISDPLDSGGGSGSTSASASGSTLTNSINPNQAPVETFLSTHREVLQGQGVKIPTTNLPSTGLSTDSSLANYNEVTKRIENEVASPGKPPTIARLSTKVQRIGTSASKGMGSPGAVGAISRLQTRTAFPQSSHEAALDVENSQLLLQNIIQYTESIESLLKPMKQFALHAPQAVDQLFFQSQAHQKNATLLEKQTQNLQIKNQDHLVDLYTKLNETDQELSDVKLQIHQAWAKIHQLDQDIEGLLTKL